MASTNRMILFLFMGRCCMISGQRECKMTTLGMEYFGQVAYTMSGRDCQAWSSQYPHQHKFNNTLKNAENYCRNPDREPQGPWCYTTDEDKRWEYCRIPQCPLTDDDCFEKGRGFMYSGKISITETGYVCRPWDSEEAYAVFGELENYCRSPDGADFPWCLSTAPGKRWERCNIPVCGESSTKKPPTTSKTTQLTSTISTSQVKPEIKPPIGGRLQNENTCTQDNNKSNRRTLTVDLVIAVLTFVGVLAAVFFCVYIVIVLNRLKLQISNQNSDRDKAVFTVENSYLTGYSDMQPIVESRT